MYISTYILTHFAMEQPTNNRVAILFSRYEEAEDVNCLMFPVIK